MTATIEIKRRNLWRVMTGDERPDIGWIDRPYETFDNVPILENMKLEKGSSLKITQHWPRIMKWNPDGGGYSQAEKEAWMVSSEGSTAMPIAYDDATRTYRQHTPEVSGGAIVNVLDTIGNFNVIECWDVTQVLPAILPLYLIYVWRALLPPKPGFSTGISYVPRGGIKFPILYWRNWGYLPKQWMVQL